MDLSRVTLIFLSFCISACLASECLTEYDSRCESCSKRMQCDENLKEYEDACHTELNELCVQVGNKASCFDLQTTCQCSGRTGCYDDPYSSQYYIDCSDNIAVYSECPEGYIHDGKCGCIEGIPKTNLDDFFLNSEKATCDFCATDPENNCGSYDICGLTDSPLAGTCPPGECFNDDTLICACEPEITTTTEDPSTTTVMTTTTEDPCDTCPYIEIPQPNGCSKYKYCSTGQYYECSSENECFDQSECGCLPVDTCDFAPPCGFYARPDISCRSYEDCRFPGDIANCPERLCFDESTCTCIDESMCACMEISTSSTPPTPTACLNCTYYSSTDACPKALECGQSNPIPFTCPTNMCFDDLTCACVPQSAADIKPKSCDTCGMMNDPEGDCRSFYNCFNKSEKYECAAGTCFDSVSCSCTEV